jgi:hypothetical protein
MKSEHIEVDDLRLRLTQLGLTPTGIDLQRMLNQMLDVEQQIVLARHQGGFADASLPWLSVPEAPGTASKGRAHVTP